MSGLRPPAKAETWEAVRTAREAIAADGGRLVLTNGCFDILHAGHVRYLNEARSLGDALCVAINADASVRKLKGPGRPVNSVEARAEVLLGLRAVDSVVIFPEERATGVIEAIAPHIYVKGGDYMPESLNPEERAALDRVGAEVRILQMVEGQSTTEALRRLGKMGGLAEGSKRLRLGVLGSGKGTTLSGLFRAIDDGPLSDAEVSLVIADVEAAPILQRAGERDVPVVFVNPGPYRNRLGEAAQKEIRDRLRSASVDLVILAGFMRRLKQPVLEAFPQRILNVHPSLLPKFPGREAWVQALEAGDKQTGATVHLVDEGIDSGRILGQKVVPILAGDGAQEVQERIQEAERELYPRVIAEYARTLAQCASA